MSPSMGGLRLVPRLDALRAVEGELLLLGLALAADRLEDDRVVVAGDEALDDPPDEPVRQPGDDRHAVRALVPLAAGELVDVVAGLTPEQLGDLLAVGRDEMDAEVLRAPGDTVGAVLVRQAGEEPRRLDADLRREADQAPRALAVAGYRRDDEHRVVQLAHERGERLDDVVGHGHVRGVLPARRRDAAPTRAGSLRAACSAPDERSPPARPRASPPRRSRGGRCGGSRGASGCASS